MLLSAPAISVLLILAHASLGVPYCGTVDLDSDQPLRIGMQAGAACIFVRTYCLAPAIAVSASSRFLIAFLCIGIIVFGIFPQPLLAMLQ